MGVYVINFYKKGAHARATKREPDPITFGTRDVEYEIGYKPTDKAKPTKKAAHDVLEHDSRKHLVLNAGHKYKVVLTNASGEDKHIKIDSSKSHSSLELPEGWALVSVDTEEKGENVN